MAGTRRSGGTNVTLTTRKRRSGGVWVDLTIAKRRTGGVWVDLFPTATAATADRTVSAGTTSPADASALYEINTNGKTYESLNGAPPSMLETWLISGLSSDFEVQAVVTSGTLTSGTTGTWVSLGSGSMAWTKTRTANTEGTDTCIFTLSIRRVSDLVVVDTSTITLSASVAL